ncbi:MAG: class I SAM-dependent methyltransferase [Candidatus Margulisiibacteriota bacterium]
MFGLKEEVRDFFDKIAPQYFGSRYGDRKDLCSAEMIGRKNAVLSFLDKYGYKNGKLLDAGCGSAVMIREFLDRGYEVCGIDISQKMIDEAGKMVKSERAHFSVGDVEAMSFPSGAFDAIVSIGVLDYLKKDEDALKEMKRVLKPGGIAILSVSNRYSLVHALRSAFAPFAKLASWKKSKEKVYCAKFSTRAHDPWGFDALLSKQGFHKLDARFVGSAFIPFNVKLPRPYLVFTERFPGLFSRFPLSAGYVVVVKR